MAMSQTQPPQQPPIAIVGLGGIFPGATDLRSFWTHIFQKSDLITDVPKSHWSVQDYFNEDPKKPDHTYCRRGGFLPEIAFDSLRYGVPPNLLSQTDTSQLLGLLVARTTLDQATRGQLEQMDRSRISVLLGVTSGQELFGQMAQRLAHPHWRAGMQAAGIAADEIETAMQKIADSMTPWTEATFPGLLGNVVAGRVANRLDLGGTNAVTDAACASSLAAISMAVDELVLGRADMVLTGGVDTLNDIFMYMCFSKTPALSPSGECRPFDAAADGTLLGEGVGMLALKRLTDAERDGDEIFAVIRGVGTSSDGRAKSVYAPVAAGQAKALRRAYESAQYSPRTVELIEAHGTGTKAGDVAEVEGLKEVFGSAAANDGRPWVALGSVKSQIGHTKAAAGAAGLLKAAMALHHKVLPPTAKVSTPNPKLGLDGSPFYINSEARPWIRGSDHPRRASVSALGFGGSNFHVALEEYVGPSQQPPRFWTRTAEVFPLSATSRDALHTQVEQLRATLTDDDAPLAFARLARRTQAEFRAVDAERVAFSASSIDALKSVVDRLLARWPPSLSEAPKIPGVFFGSGPQNGKLAFLFPGQGSQYLNMGRGAALHFEAVRRVFDRSADVLLDGTPIADCVFPPPAFDAETAERQAAELTRTENAQPALGALEAGLLAQLDALHIQPDLVGGHSFGEITALYAAGVFDLSSLIHIARRRGELMAQSSETPGAMAAVIGDLARTRAVLSDLNLAELVLANENAPEQGVISGPSEQVDAAIVALEKAGLQAKRLNVSTAFHSALVADAAPALLDFLEDVRFSPAARPVFCNTTAAAYPADADTARELLAEQLAKPVRFVEQIENMYEAGARTFVEVGPNQVLTRLTRQILDGRPHVAIETDHKDKEGVLSLMNALAQLCAAGYAPRFEALWESVEAPEPRPKSDAKPGLLVPLSGSNFGKPAFPAPTAPKTPPPAGIRPAELSAASGAPASAATSPSPASVPSMTESKLNARPPAPPMVSTAASSPNAGAWLDVFRQTQQQSAEAHATFQRTMAEAHMAYLRAFEASASQMAALIAGEGASPVAVAASQPPVFPAASFGAVAASPYPATSEAPLPAVEVHTAPLPARVDWAPPHAAPQAPLANAVFAHAASPTQKMSLRDTLFEVVAEKTGYPLEALEDEMALEADLGIDSIKRVEILGALKERAPGLRELDAMQMAQLATLGEIAHSLQAGPETPSLGRTEASAGLPPPRLAETPRSTSSNGAEMQTLFLSVVADKTGYPVEALQLDMNLEADLGVDSIKRVEILGALKERAPDLPELDAMQLSKLSTLQEIADALHPQVRTSMPAPALQDTAVEPSLTEAFLSVVADKTGYPIEALQLDMNLEADLGVDSIKRVEILGALKERLPALPELDAMQMSKLSTLAEIADALAAKSTGTTSGNGLTHGTPTQGNGVLPPFERGAIERAELSIAPLRDSGAPLKMASAGTIALMGADHPFVQLFAERLQARGYRVRWLHSANDVVDVEDWAGLFLMGPTQSVQHTDQALAVVRQAFDITRACAKSLQTAAQHRKVALVSVQDTGGRFGTTLANRAQALVGGIAGLLKTAAQEWPEIAAKIIDLDVTQMAPDEAAAALETEIFVHPATLEVGISAAGRVAPMLQSVFLRENSASLLPPGAVIVATGGARGVTATSLEALCEETKPTLVLLGRTPLDESIPPSCVDLHEEAALKRALFEDARAAGRKPRPAEMGQQAKRILAVRDIQAQLDRYQKLGAITQYYAVDVRDRDALAAALADARAKHGPIQALVHGAGVLADRRIEDKTLEQYDLVLDTKVAGLLTLLEVTEHDPLRVIALFSSVAGRFGNVGQADYAVANEMLNKLAQTEQRVRAGDCVVKSMNWGPWAGGMVTPALNRQFAERGVAVLPLEQGARFFAAELSAAAPRNSVETVFGGPLAAKRAALPASEAGEAEVWTGSVHVHASQQPWLADHSILGVPVLPAVFAAELLVDMAQMACPGHVVCEVRDLRVLRGLKLDRFASSGHDLHIELQPLPLPARGLSAAIRTPGALGPHYAATLLLRPARDEGPVGAQAPAPGSSYDLPIRELYRERLFHGPQFHLLTDIIGISEDGMEARAQGIFGAGWPDAGLLGGGWQSDSALLDASLQLLLLFARHRNDAAFLPTGFESLTLYRGSGPQQTALLRLRSTAVTKDRVVCDVDILDPAGRILMSLGGASAHRLLDDSAFMAASKSPEVRVS